LKLSALAAIAAACPACRTAPDAQRAREAALSPPQRTAAGRCEITLQYRIGLDAATPSSFIAEYAAGTTWRLRIHWDILWEEQAALERVIAHLEEHGPNGARFRCVGRWLREGWELCVTEVAPLFPIPDGIDVPAAWHQGSQNG
jgi:hypothetical protein